MRSRLLKIFLALASAAMAGALADMLCALFGFAVPMPLWLLLVGAGALLPLVKKTGFSSLKRSFFGLLSALLCLGLAIPLALFAWTRTGAYELQDPDRQALYGDRRVLVIAPHQDDELNLASGIIDEYIRYGSELRILFVTNGDYSGLELGLQRQREALGAAERMGLQAEDLIFLGYGDAWAPGGPHIYNASPDQALSSFCGETRTYGGPGSPAYNEGRLYTRRHLLEDMKGVILDYMPDTILCVDQDAHSDHRASSMIFEEALGQILREQPDYCPAVLKGFCYPTAFFAPEDFFSPNLLSTQNTYSQDLVKDVNIYKWSERLRLPLGAEALSHSLLGCRTYWQCCMHRSQGLYTRSDRIINGDKVFWLRDTSSLSYEAEISVSSGEGERLNDFKLADRLNIDLGVVPADGVWSPENGDAAPWALIELAQPAALTELRLYDDPDLESNVLNARLSFDNGQSIETGPLEPGGSATVIELQDLGQVKSVKIELLETQGEEAGLTEAELYTQRHDYGLDFIKLMDLEGNFVYDYYIDESGRQSFELYTGAVSQPLTEEGFSLSWDNPACSAEIQSGRIELYCPRGESMELEISQRSGTLTDRARISNPGLFSRRIWPSFEEHILKRSYPALQESSSYLILRTIYRLIRYS